jgi:4-hydroxybenzoate polyprenyltransferase
MGLSLMSIMRDHGKWATHIKAIHWWVYKMSGAFMTFGLFTAWHELPLTLYHYGRFGILLLLLSVLAVLGHATNDYFDHAIDLKAGKKNIRNSIGKRNTRVLLFFLLVTSGLIALSFSQFGLMLLWVVQIILNLSYSAPPLRLKERGWASTVVTGFYERVIPYVMIHEVLIPQTIGEGWEIPHAVYAYLLWSYLWECRNHLRGQGRDRASDLAAGVRTLSAMTDRTQLPQYTRSVLVVEFTFLVAWVLHSPYTLIGAALSMLATVIAKMRPEKSEVNELQWHIDMVYVHAFPQFILLLLSFSMVTLIPLFIVVCLIFRNVLYALVNLLDNAAEIGSNSVLGCVSYVVNQSIYRFRRKILMWSEERSRAQSESWIWK